MKVSVIVLSYNSADTIRRTLDSVLAQRCDFDFEIVAGDDGSTDGTAEILKEYAARHSCMRLLLAKENHGLQANYFDCLEACRGEYIADCAADDYWPDCSRLQLMADALDAHPAAGMVFTDWTQTDIATGQSRLCHPTPARDCDRGELGARLLESHGKAAVMLSATLYRKSVLMPAYDAARDTLFRNPEYGCEDLQILMALSESTPSVYLPVDSICYFTGGDAAITSTADMAKAARFALSTLRLRTELKRRFGIDSARIRRAEAAIYAHALGSAARSGDTALLGTVRSFASEMKKLSLKTRMRLWYINLKDLFEK